MRYSAVMVYIDTGGFNTARVDLACEVARHFEARLIGVSASAAQPRVVLPEKGPATISLDMSPYLDHAEADLRCAKDLFHRVAQVHECRLEWRSSIDNPNDFVASEGRAADIILAGRMGNDVSPHHAIDPAKLIVYAGRPVLVVPASVKTSLLGSHAVIAWKDCREARRAVLDALPLLSKSKNVSVINIVEGDQRLTALQQTSDVECFLAHHGIISRSVIIEDDGRSISRQITDFAKAHQTGLIVMGARIHARLHDWTIGGETHDMLKKCPICLLLSN